MVRAQEFIIDLIKNSGESYDAIQDKSGVSKSTISRLMKGIAVSSSSMRLIADSFGRLEDFLVCVSETADPHKAAEELRERYEHAELILTESYEDRIRSLNLHIKTLQSARQEMRDHYEARLAHMDRIHDKERAVDQEHFEKERAVWNALNDRSDARIARLQRNNLSVDIFVVSHFSN